MSTDLDPARQLLTDGFGRIRDGVPAVVDGLAADDLLWRPDPESNHLAWLLWHLSRQQDAQVAAVAGRDQAWQSAGFVDRFALPYPPDTHGFGMSAEDVGAFPSTDPQLFAEYQGAVADLTRDVVEGLTTEDLERVIDDSWDPPVTVSSRLISVFDDAAKHLGQAEYVKGLLQRRG